MSVIELLVLMIWVVAAQELEPPSLDIDYGTVQGSWSNSLRGRPYACFEGIPYAEPPVGSLRFQPLESHLFQRMSVIRLLVYKLSIDILIQ
ncbi:unnamed protein product [Chilo suppressalis]|uniref:Carboxylesterase type B domain-containing protein n=1 Tax=Chilo suppressalis TaxID=168631 RepID=A0ABN8E9T1_CHISP|nr:unnamed protein product [Chilo suppressalis]